MKNKISFAEVLTIIFIFLLSPVAVSAQSGGAFEILQSVIASGGSASSGGNFTVENTSGQTIAAEQSDNTPFTIKSGFWTSAPFAPTAAEVTIGGRALAFSGHGIPRVFISLTDGNGVTRTVITNAFGYYRFTAIEVGQICVISVRSKVHQFAQPTQVLFVREDVSELNFTALP
jgi:hypothetical protein